MTVGFGFVTLSASAQDFSHIRIVRLSFIEGNVQYQRPGEEWQDAKLNLPIQEGFALRTGDGFAEVEFEDSATVRIATNSTLEFTGLALQDGGRSTHLTIPEGTAIFNVKLKRGDAVSVATSDLTVNLPHNGRFRVDASPNASWVTVFHGKIEVNSNTGRVSSVNGGHTLRTDGSSPASIEVAANPPQDDFDKWVNHREDAVSSSQSETSSIMQVNSYTAGFADMYDYGVWSNIPGYGSGWMPYGVGPGWMPFTAGGWQYMGVTGWNWVSAEPWGWFPYHFGSWVNAPGIGWAWLPVGAMSYSPATARWVQVNNQLGWVPNGPTLTPKASKTQLAAVPATAILASRDGSGAIKAGSTIPLARAGAMVQAVAAPVPGFVAGHASPNQFSNLSNRQIQPFSTAHASRLAAPASLRAPTAAAPHIRMGQLSSLPHAITAPHSMPAPAIARGAGMGGQRGGLAAQGVRGSYGTMGTANATGPAPSSQGASVGLARSGPSSGATSGHR